MPTKEVVLSHLDRNELIAVAARLDCCDGNGMKKSEIAYIIRRSSRDKIGSALSFCLPRARLLDISSILGIAIKGRRSKRDLAETLFAKSTDRKGPRRRPDGRLMVIRRSTRELPKNKKSKSSIRADTVPAANGQLGGTRGSCTSGSTEELTRQLGELKKQVAKLMKDKTEEKRHRNIRLAVAPKGGVSLYGLRRFPITLYLNEWNVVLGMSAEILAFLRDHDGELVKK